MKHEDALFRTGFLDRFSSAKAFIPLGGVLISGILIGSVGAVLLEVFHNQPALPMFFSGIPVPESGFWPCFSTVLLSLLIGLIILFLLGVTAFGVFGVPIFLFCKGASLAVGVLSFLAQGGISEFWYCALGYTPAAAAACFLLLLFAVRALAFSKSLVRASFTSGQESLNFQFYFRDFLSFLCFAVIISLAGAFFAILGSRIL